MKTTKKLFFAMAAFVALSVSFTSCDAIKDATTKEVEVKAPAIEFNIGGTAAAAPQKVSAEGILEYVWLDSLINLKSELETELGNQGLTVAQVQTLLVTSSEMTVVSSFMGKKYPAYDLGSATLYIDGKKVATSAPWVWMGVEGADLTYTAPTNIFELLAAGKMRVKIVSDKPAPSEQLILQLKNTYKGKISLLD